MIKVHQKHIHLEISGLIFIHIAWVLFLEVKNKFGVTLDTFWGDFGHSSMLLYTNMYWPFFQSSILLQVCLIFSSRRENQNKNWNITLKINAAGSLSAEALKCALYISHNKTFLDIVQIS